MQSELKSHLLNVATEPYRGTGKFNYGWARGKLGHDPIFTALIERAIFSDGMRILDLGCGRGLLAAWFLAAEVISKQGKWSEKISPPSGLSFCGVELMTREAACGNMALQPIYGERVKLRGGDMRTADTHGYDAIAILDVLHYIPIAEQDRLLDLIRAGLEVDGVFVTRVGDEGSGLRFLISRLVDFCISFAQGHRLEQMWCRSINEWIKVLEAKNFSVKAIPMSSGTPFANVLLVCRAI